MGGHPHCPLTVVLYLQLGTDPIKFQRARPARTSSDIWSGLVGLVELASPAFRKLLLAAHLLIQARGRSRRIGPLAVENLEMSLEETFQSRIMRTTILKSLPSVMAQLTLNVCEVGDISRDDDDDINIGSWNRVRK